MIRNYIAFGLIMGAVLIYGVLLNHTYQPSNTNGDVPEWPVGSPSEVQASCLQLIAFAHPHCPCFNTTLTELIAISGQFPELRVRVVFATPDGAPDGWHLGRNWDGVSAAGFVAIADEGCIETRKFKATASGQLMLFKDGRCLFHGGITAGRGHSGPSAGKDELIRVLNTCEPSTIAYPVFGCPLFNEGTKI